MSIYENILYLCLVLAALLKVRKQTVLFYFMILVMIVLAAIRGLNVGVDTINYYVDFINQTNTHFSERGESEIVFSYIEYFFRNNLNYDLYMFFVYSLILVPVAIVIKKISTNYFFSLFLYISCGFYTNSFNVMRQFLAASIMLIGFLMLEGEKRKIKYLFWLLLVLAYYIHNATLILVPLYFIRKVEIPKPWMYVFVAASFVIGFFLNNLLGGFYTRLAEFEMGGRLSSYLEYEGSGIRNFITNFGMNVVFLVSLFFVSEKTKNSIFFKAFFMSMIVFNLVGNMYYMTRLTFFYSIAQIICIPVILSEMKPAPIGYKGKNVSRFSHISINSIVYLFMILGYSLMRFYVKELQMFLPYTVRPEISLFSF